MSILSKLLGLVTGHSSGRPARVSATPVSSSEALPADGSSDMARTGARHAADIPGRHSFVTAQQAPPVIQPCSPDENNLQQLASEAAIPAEFGVSPDLTVAVSASETDQSAGADYAHSGAPVAPLPQVASVNGSGEHGKSPIGALSVTAWQRNSYLSFPDELSVKAITGLKPKELMLKFDTAGEGCEFGFVQRHFGAEPISLLRFAGLSWEETATALDAGFDGIDAPGNVTTEHDNGPEWDIRELRYGLVYHTFVKTNSISKEKFLATHARRLRWLADKFLSDIEASEKIFVAWRAFDGRSPDIMPLFRALRRRGDVTLIWVEAEDGDPGVHEIQDGLLKGRVRWLTRPQSPDRDDSGWLAMLANAWVLLYGRCDPERTLASENEISEQLVSAAASDPIATDSLAAMRSAAEALDRGDRVEAMTQWRIARMSPDAPLEAWLLATEHGADLLGVDGLVDLLQEGAERFPGTERLIVGLARAEESRQGWQAAEAHWRSIIARADAPWWAYTALATNLQTQDRGAEALSILDEAADIFPDERQIAIDRARAVQSTGDWPEAVVRWEQMIHRFPHDWVGYNGKFVALANDGRLDEADRFLELAAADFPDDIGAINDLGRAAERHQNWSGAEKAWRSFIAVARHPYPWPYECLANALRKQRRFAEADEVVLSVMEQFPDDASLHESYGVNAMAEEAWDVALARFDKARIRFPDDPTFLERINEVRAASWAANAETSTSKICAPQNL